MFLLNVKMTSSSILEMQRSEWPETLTNWDAFRWFVQTVLCAKNKDKTHLAFVGNNKRQRESNVWRQALQASVLP